MFSIPSVRKLQKYFKEGRPISHYKWDNTKLILTSWISIFEDVVYVAFFFFLAKTVIITSPLGFTAGLRD